MVRARSPKSGSAQKLSDGGSAAEANRLVKAAQSRSALFGVRANITLPQIRVATSEQWYGKGRMGWGWGAEPPRKVEVLRYHKHVSQIMKL